MQLRLSLVLTVVLISLSGKLTAQEPKPSIPSPKIESQPQKAQTAKTSSQRTDDQRGSKERPFVIEILQPQVVVPYTDQKPAQNDSKPPEDKTVEKWSAGLNALASIVIAFFTGFLWWTSRKQWHATSMSATAALTTANSLTAAERAYVFVNVKPVPIGFTETIPPQMIANCCNHGKTPAQIGSIHCKPEIVPSIPLSLPPMLEEELPEGLVIASDGIYGLTTGWRDPIPPDQIEKLTRGESLLVCYGFIRYYDMFDGEWETGFCWQYDPAARRFRISNSPLNYCKKADPHEI
jgi:hypothetical protein